MATAEEAPDPVHRVRAGSGPLPTQVRAWRALPVPECETAMKCYTGQVFELSRPCAGCGDDATTTARLPGFRQRWICDSEMCAVSVLDDWSADHMRKLISFSRAETMIIGVDPG